MHVGANKSNMHGVPLSQKGKEWWQSGRRLLRSNLSTSSLDTFSFRHPRCRINPGLALHMEGHQRSSLQPPVGVATPVTGDSCTNAPSSAPTSTTNASSAAYSSRHLSETHLPMSIYNCLTSPISTQTSFFADGSGYPQQQQHQYPNPHHYQQQIHHANSLGFGTELSTNVHPPPQSTNYNLTFHHITINSSNQPMSIRHCNSPQPNSTFQQLVHHNQWACIPSPRIHRSSTQQQLALRAAITLACIPRNQYIKRSNPGPHTGSGAPSFHFSPLPPLLNTFTITTTHTLHIGHPVFSRDTLAPHLHTTLAISGTFPLCAT